MAMMSNPSHYKFSTQVIHEGQKPDPATGATVVPIYATSTFTQLAPGETRGYEYSRTGNPTRTALETCLAALECGDLCAAFASGMAATTAVFSSLLRPGDEVVAPTDLYGGTYRMLETIYKPWGVAARYTEDLSPAGFSAHFGPKTRIVWIESPTNPLLQIVDIEAIARAAHHVGAILVVDNTFASPYLQQPLGVGADLVVHSTTKYIAGHSDIIGGAVIGSRDLMQPVFSYQNGAGAVPGPFDVWLTLRGLKTLAVRMDRHCANANRLAAWLAKHPRVEKVYYPGLPDHPGHDVARRQMRHFGGMITVRLRGTRDDTFRFLTSTRIFSLAESLGGVESLLSHPPTMTHAGVPPEIRAQRGWDDNVVRISVGIEDVGDLQADLARALEL
jgi:cystathionine beta-lyase/cystathionine gamma-synthase